MDQHQSPASAESFAYRAFEDLRAEVSLLRRGVEALTAERQSAPDYAPSLAKIDEHLLSFIGWAEKVNERPGIKLGPQSFAAELVRVGERARQEDAQALARAQAGFDEAARRIEALMIRGRTVAEQSRALLHNRIYSLIGGMLIWAIAPGALARSFPVSWVVPERIAARMLGLDMRAAGERLIVAADPALRGQLLRPRHIGTAKPEQSGSGSGDQAQVLPAPRTAAATPCHRIRTGKVQYSSCRNGRLATEATAHARAKHGRPEGDRIE